MPTGRGTMTPAMKSADEITAGAVDDFYLET
jgi:hypothetical protein